MERPTRIRWSLLGLLFFISFVTYLDRINIAVAGKLMSEAFGLTDLQFGTIFSAFVVGYALFQVPAGWVGDRFGHKRTLVFSLILWSCFTALTPWAGRGFLVSMVGVVPAIWIVRFLIGLGEAASYPSSNALVGRWFPSKERGLATRYHLCRAWIGDDPHPAVCGLAHGDLWLGNKLPPLRVARACPGGGALFLPGGETGGPLADQ